MRAARDSRLPLALDHLSRPIDGHRILDRLGGRALAHVRCERSIHRLTIGPFRKPDRVVHVDLRQKNDPIHDLVRAFGLTADVTVRYCNPAHFQCAV